MIVEFRLLVVFVALALYVQCCQSEEVLPVGKQALTHDKLALFVVMQGM